jgi:hypothetical protein
MHAMIDQTPTGRHASADKCDCYRQVTNSVWVVGCIQIVCVLLRPGAGQHAAVLHCWRHMLADVTFQMAF